MATLGRIDEKVEMKSQLPFFRRKFHSSSRTTMAAMARNYKRRVELALARKTMESRSSANEGVPQFFPLPSPSTKRKSKKRTFFDEHTNQNDEKVDKGTHPVPSTARNSKKRCAPKEGHVQAKVKRNQNGIRSCASSSPSLSAAPDLESEPRESICSTPPLHHHPVDLRDHDCSHEVQLFKSKHDELLDGELNNFGFDETNDANWNDEEDAESDLIYKKPSSRKRIRAKRTSSGEKAEKCEDVWIYDRINDWDEGEIMQWHRVRVSNTAIAISDSKSIAVDVVFLEAPSQPEKMVFVSQLITSREKQALGSMQVNNNDGPSSFPFVPLSFLVLTAQRLYEV